MSQKLPLPLGEVHFFCHYLMATESQEDLDGKENLSDIKWEKNGRNATLLCLYRMLWSNIKIIKHRFHKYNNSHRRNNTNLSFLLYQETGTFGYSPRVIGHFDSIITKVNAQFLNRYLSYLV